MQKPVPQNLRKSLLVSWKLDISLSHLSLSTLIDYLGTDFAVNTFLD